MTREPYVAAGYMQGKTHYDVDWNLSRNGVRCFASRCSNIRLVSGLQSGTYSKDAKRTTTQIRWPRPSRQFAGGGRQAQEATFLTCVLGAVFRLEAARQRKDGTELRRRLQHGLLGCD